jgi:hypothetical protein
LRNWDWVLSEELFSTDWVLFGEEFLVSYIESFWIDFISPFIAKTGHGLELRLILSTLKSVITADVLSLRSFDSDGHGHCKIEEHVQDDNQQKTGSD